MNQSKPNSIGTEVKPNANESGKCKCCNYYQCRENLRTNKQTDIQTNKQTRPKPRYSHR